MGFYNVSWVLMLSLQSSNTSGMTKKSFVSVSIAVFYAVGNIIGPQFFLGTQAPTYALGIGAMLCSFVIMGATGILYFVLVFMENKRRDKLFGKPNQSVQAAVAVGLETEALDQTDGENTSFRYVY
jgi:hypothetical protein